MKIRMIILFLLFTLQGCEKPVEWDQKERVTPRLVVEAMLTNQPDFNYVILSLPVTDPNLAPQPVSGAAIMVTDGTTFVNLTEDPETPGRYLPPLGTIGVVNRGYRLTISLNGEIFQADAYMIPVTPLPPFIYSAVEPEPGYFRIDPSEGNPPAYTRYSVDWEEPGDPPVTMNSLFYSYSISTIDVNQFFKPAQERLIFPSDARIARARFSMSPGYETYIRSMLSETEWSGGWFDLLPGNLPTNLTNGAVGYFAACSVIIDTVYFE
jgi:hypothetical protein